MNKKVNIFEPHLGYNSQLRGLVVRVFACKTWVNWIWFSLASYQSGVRRP